MALKPSRGSGERIVTLAISLSFALVLSVLAILTLGQSGVTKELSYDEAPAVSVLYGRERTGTTVPNELYNRRNQIPPRPGLQNLLSEEDVPVQIRQ